MELTTAAAFKGPLLYLPEPGRANVLMSTHEVSEVEPGLDMVSAVRDGQVKEIDEVDNIRDRHGLSLVEWMKETLGKG